MKNNVEILSRLGDELELKVREYERGKLETLSDSFYSKTIEEQIMYLNKNKVRQDEIDKLKVEINKLEDEHREISSRYNNMIQDGELWLGDVIDIERPKFGSNNLLLAPVGSGKTYVIQNILARRGSGYQLLLVPSRHLKNSIAPDSNELREEDGDNVFTSANRVVYGGSDHKVHVMTYKEFGYRITNNDNFIRDNNIEVIYCDEIHSLVEYKNYAGDEQLTHALRYLFLSQPGVKIYYFTATTEHLNDLEKRDPEKFANIEVFDYLDYPNIKKYTNLSVHEVNHIEQIRNRLSEYVGDFKAYGYKGLAFQNTITGMKSMATMLTEEGFTPLMLWSTSTGSSHGPMDDEQLRALDELIETEEIPEGYDFLIINNAMREGWNLRDDKVQVAIMNTISETNQVQARGRIRNNIALMIVRTSEPVEQRVYIEVEDKYIDTPLTTKDKNELCKDLNVRNSNGVLMKWRSVSELLIQEGYVIEDSRIRVEGKQLRVSTITE